MSTDPVALVGAITGVASLSVLVYRTLLDRPRLSVELMKGRHTNNKAIRPERNSQSWLEIELRVNNSGDKGTTITRFEIEFSRQGRAYHASEVPIEPLDPLTRKWTFNHHIRPNDSSYAYTRFEYPNETFEEPELECGLIIHHTHGRIPMKYISRFEEQITVT